MASPPKIGVFLLCDAAVQDPATGKSTLVGVFDRIAASSFPATHGAFAIYLRMTGLNGQYEMVVQILSPDLESVVAETQFPDRLVVSDRLDVVEAALNLPGMVLPAPGRYTVRLVYNGVTGEELTFLVDPLS